MRLGRTYLGLATKNVGALSGRSREVVDMFKRRRVDIERLVG